MSDSFIKESRKHWVAQGATPSTEQLGLGCLQRIADATELMAKRYEDLIAQRDMAFSQRDYWREQHDSMARRLNSMRGVITKLKAKLPPVTTKDGAAA
jgi:hypothetical protein